MASGRRPYAQGIGAAWRFFVSFAQAQFGAVVSGRVDMVHPLAYGEHKLRHIESQMKYSSNNNIWYMDSEAWRAHDDFMAWQRSRTMESTAMVKYFEIAAKPAQGAP